MKRSGKKRKRGGGHAMGVRLGAAGFGACGRLGRRNRWTQSGEPAWAVAAHRRCVRTLRDWRARPDGAGGDPEGCVDRDSSSRAGRRWRMAPSTCCKVTACGWRSRSRWERFRFGGGRRRSGWGYGHGRRRQARARHGGRAAGQALPSWPAPAPASSWSWRWGSGRAGGAGSALRKCRPDPLARAVGVRARAAPGTACAPAALIFSPVLRGCPQ